MFGATKKWTYDDLALLPEDGLRHEIIDGVHYVNGSPITRNQLLLYRLVLTIAKYLEDHPLRQLYFAPYIVLSDYDEERREIAMVSNDQAAPELLIEVPDKRCEGATAHALYERTGVGEYWIVDAARDVVRIFRRNAAGRYEQAAELSENDTLTSSLFPTLEIHLQRIFSD